MAVADHQNRWRPQPAEFLGRDERGRWQVHGTTGLFEVLCSTCGDDDGPYDEASPEVQALRGPYRSIELVREAVVVHRLSEEP
ncbi:MAG TPA: hypothetical protein VNF07_02805 [Acidimicrobiales bacterium]|nr:hypothetical protein [Acidimicrobiales bacterium]